MGILRHREIEFMKIIKTILHAKRVNETVRTIVRLMIHSTRGREKPPTRRFSIFETRESSSARMDNKDTSTKDTGPSSAEQVLELANNFFQGNRVVDRI